MDNTYLLKERKLIHYLQSLEQESTFLSVLGQQTWVQLKNFYPTVDIPDCCPKDDFTKLMFTWNNNEHYLECEMFLNGNIEFFYKNRITQNSWGKDFLLYDPALISKLLLFSHE